MEGERLGVIVIKSMLKDAVPDFAYDDRRRFGM